MEQQEEPRSLLGPDAGHKHIQLSISDICPNGHALVDALRALLAKDEDASVYKEVWPRTWVHESRTRIAIRLLHDDTSEASKPYVELRDLIDDTRVPFCSLRVVKPTVAGDQELATYERLSTEEITSMYEKIYAFLNTGGTWA